MKNVLVLVSILLVVGCGDDDGTSAPSQETTGTITGTLTLTGDGCPTEDITIGLFAVSPFSGEPGPPAAFTSDFTIENNSYSYTISDIVFGTYEYLAVGWDDPAADSEANQIPVAFYGQYGTPTPVTLSADSPTLEDADMSGDCTDIASQQ